jgi:hypothetical protein
MHMSTLWHHAQFIFLSEEILVDFSITVFQYLVKCQCKCLCILSWHAGIEIPLAIRRAVDLWFMVFYNITSNHFRNQIALCKNENHMSKSSYCFRYFPVYAIITSLIFSNLWVWPSLGFTYKLVCASFIMFFFPYTYILLNLLMLQSSCTAKPCLRIQRKKWYNGQPHPPIIQYIKTWFMCILIISQSFKK